MKGAIVIGVALLCASPVTRALTYPWKTVTAVEVKNTSSVTAVYTLYYENITITDDSITPTSTVQEVMMRKTGASAGVAGYAYWGAFHRHNSGSASTPDTAALSVKKTSRGTGLWSDFAQDVASAPNMSVENHSQTPVGGECVGSTAWVQNLVTSPPFDSWIASDTWNGGYVGSTCISTPPANEWCALTVPTLTMSYGTINLTSATGKVAEATATVECTSGMSYALRLRGSNPIALSNGMTATLMAGGKPIGSTLVGRAGGNAVTLTSTLNGNPNRTGAFTGTDILFVSYP